MLPAPVHAVRVHCCLPALKPRARARARPQEVVGPHELYDHVDGTVTVVSVRRRHLAPLAVLAVLRVKTTGSITRRAKRVESQTT